MKPTRRARWASSDGRFGVEVQPAALDRALVLCEQTRASETGGIIVGRYATKLDCAMVTQLSGPPKDSRAGPTWFLRGTQGLAAYLRALWARDRRYYLGEWHFHPRASAQPSHRDAAQMQEIARDPRYSCPEPLLLIIGGSPPAAYELAAFVALATHQTLIPLDRHRERPSTL